MAKTPHITVEELRQRLDYCPETGIFVWRRRIIRPSHNRTDKSWNGRYAGKPAGSETSTHGYVVISIDKQMYLAHRLAWAYMTGSWPAIEIDHINRIRSDNRFVNLREASKQENRCNSGHKVGATGVVGVRKNGSGFQAVIGHNYKTIVLGQFKTIEDARQAREEAAAQLHGNFARAK